MTKRFPWSSKEAERKEAIRMLAAMVGAIVLSRAVDDEALAGEILMEVSDGLTDAHSGANS
jgi:TetR/AcrR family transcriptional repressor of nem operon